MYGLTAVLLIIVGQIVVTRMQSRRIDRRLDEKMQPMHDQLVNDHGSQPNLREDIDELKVGMIECNSTISRIGSEVRLERAENQRFRRDTFARLERQDRIAEKNHPEDMT